MAVISAVLPAASGPLDGAGLDRAYAAPAAAWTRANFAITLDGGVALDGRSGGIGGPADRVVFAHLRSMADVVLVAAGTATTERYGVVHLDEEAAARRRARGQAPGVPVAVVTGGAGLDPGARLFVEAAEEGQARPIVLTTAAAPPESVAALGAVADVVVCGDTKVETAAALDALAGRGLTRVLCEGGPSLLAQLVAAGRLDELCLTLAPVLAGPGHGDLMGAQCLDVPAPLRLHGLLTDDAGTLFTRYRPTPTQPPTQGEAA